MYSFRILDSKNDKLGFSPEVGKMACQLVGMIFECGFDYPHMGSENGIPTCGHDDFIPENIFYCLARKAKNETIKKF